MLGISQTAVQMVLAVARAHGAEPRLRIRVIGGGCSGLTWDWSLGDVGSTVGDLRRTTDGVTVVVDAQSAAYVRGATIDVGAAPGNGLRPPLDPDGGRSLVLRGLTAVRHACGCGESFSV
jgi:Fe-S cluster assembly iron-binding protein IscA